MLESVTSARVIGEVVAASLWCLIVIAAMVGRSWLGPIEILFLLAPLVLVPLGFRLVQRQVGEYSLVGRAARSVRPFAAILAAASFWPPAGRAAAVPATAWLLVCGLAAIDDLWWLVQRGSRSAEGVCNSVSFFYLAVGAVWQPTFLTFGSVLSPGCVSYQVSIRVAPRQPSSLRFPSMTMGAGARARRIDGPLSADCAAAGAAADARRRSATTPARSADIAHLDGGVGLVVSIGAESTATHASAITLRPLTLQFSPGSI